MLCRVKYCNSLPDIPFDPKFLSFPFENKRFVSYKSTSLEAAYKYDLLTEHDLGVTIDLINPDTYAVQAGEGTRICLLSRHTYINNMIIMMMITIKKKIIINFEFPLQT